jgi:copper chaperone CopZ
MSSFETAIVHLRDGQALPGGDAVLAVLRPLRGVAGVDVCPAESLVAIRFDHDLIGLAEIVRTLEDDGTAVAGVAQRRSPIEDIDLGAPIHTES